ncbi:MAG: DUF3105 domain-containing protein [Actinomycetota bacterium]|nr:DUF3105 domain-containing protein [Actinomycetota bacterium]
MTSLLCCAVALAGCGGEETTGPQPPQAPEVELPQQKTASLKEAVKTAGCELKHPKVSGENLHAERAFKATDYNSNPPTSGEHTPDWYDDGVYEPGTVAELGKLVHTLEHGRINLQYKPGTPQDTVDKLQAVVAEQADGYHFLLYENTTKMDYAVAATAWGHLVGCREVNDDAFDVIRTFREQYIDKAPEFVD